MPTNSTTFNSRITSENLEAKFREVFPSQAGAELIQDLYAQGVIVPTVDFSNAALNSGLTPDLQQAWDFATTNTRILAGGSATAAATPGFYKVWGTYSATDTAAGAGGARLANISLTDGLSTKQIWGNTQSAGGTTDEHQVVQIPEFVVFVKVGTSLTASTINSSYILDIYTRQLADVYGNLTNPNGFVSQ